MMKSNYWYKRRQKEKRWQQQQLKSDRNFNRQLQKYYDQAILRINKDIESEINFLANRDQVSFADTQKAVNNTDISEYEVEAQKVVQEANRLRAQGKQVTYNDFSNEVNKRMQWYNRTMRVNRLELLKSKIGLAMVESGMNVDADMQKKITSDYTDELKRQAGILNDATENAGLWTSKTVAKQITKQISGSTFSQRIWKNQDALKAQLESVITSGIIQGQNPRVMARKIKAAVSTTVKNHRYVTERIARTESARVQHSAQLEMIKKNGYRFVQWIAEPKACSDCATIARKDNGYGEGIYKIDKVPRIPDDTHPNCRCSITETWVEGKQNLTLSNDEQAALNNYISSASYKINDDLRRGVVSDNEKQFVKYLDAALAKMPIYTGSKPVQRDYFFQDNEQKQSFVSQMDNDWFEDSAYISTSKIHYGQGEEQVHVIIKDSKTGRDISEYNENEQEVLFPRNTRFKVEDFYTNDDGILTVVWSE